MFKFLGGVDGLIEDWSGHFEILWAESERGEWADVGGVRQRVVERRSGRTYGAGPLAFPQLTICEQSIDSISHGSDE